MSRDLFDNVFMASIKTFLTRRRTEKSHLPSCFFMSLYRLSHRLQSGMPWLWNVVEWGNSVLFSWRYGRKLKEIPAIEENYNDHYLIKEVEIVDVERLAYFFSEQPKEAFAFFNPHGFDFQSLSRLVRRKSFLMFLVIEGDDIVGYFFLRCFVFGKCFRGKMVDYRWRNRGIAKLMGLASTDIAQKLGLRIFGTISKENVTSMASSAAVNEIRIIKELPNDYVYIEYLPKQNDAS